MSDKLRKFECSGCSLPCYLEIVGGSPTPNACPCYKAYDTKWVEFATNPKHESVKQLVEDINIVKDSLCMEDLGAYANGYCISMRDGLEKALKKFEEKIK